MRTSSLPLCHSAVGVLLVCSSFASAQPADVKKPAPPSAEAVRFFESKVRPILSESCFKCHADKKQKGNLRVDSLVGLLQGGEQGPAIVPGHPEKSLLVKAISHEDNELKMPPSQKLSKEQCADLTQWIKMGAPWPGVDPSAIVTGPRKGEHTISEKDRAHWSFQPVRRPPVPAVKNSTWSANPIDAFILAKLEAKGMQANPAATRQELCRRLFYDLTGLPPTPQEVESFLADAAPDAYEKLVDRLLESPRYGEKWARHWLDLVRYAETNSYERDNAKPQVWRYRDYVIRAFNQDKPYDRFLREQLAGDEMPGADTEALIATGFYRLGIWDDEPSDPTLARYDGLDDIVATTSQVFLGLTVDCARCHDHKIDPILQKDYYRLMSFFHNINHYRNGGRTDLVPLFAGAAAKVNAGKAAQALAERRDAVQVKISAIQKEFRDAYANKLAGGDLDDLQYRFYRGAWRRLPDFDGIKHESEGKLPKGLFDIAPRTRNDTFGFVFEGVLIVPQAGKFTFYLDSDDGSRLSVGGKKVLEYDGIHGAGKEKQVKVDLPAGRLPIRLEYFQNINGYGLSVAWSGPGFVRRSLSSASEESRSADFADLIRTQGLNVLGEERIQVYKQLQKELADLKKQRPDTVESALAVTESGKQAPETFVFLRGNPQVKGERVEPAFLEVLGGARAEIAPPSSDRPSSGRRTALAGWLNSKDNPLTARVMVNRIWQYHFGRGIVRSPNDYGMHGSRPTHPELLDWLASEFVDQGWSMKKLHRLMLTSNAYRMSSRGNPEALAADPTNDLLWRFDMRRLTGEEIRDSLLAVCGNLNLKMGGPSIFPEIPKEVLAGQSAPGRGWTPSTPDEQNRRSVYVHVKRSLLLPILESFDLAEPDRTTPVRFSTTQPTQALGMINGEFLNKQAKVFAERLRREAGKDVAAQVRLALYLATARAPTTAEVQRGLRLLEGLRQQEGVSEEGALNCFCLMVLNLSEFVYLD